MSYFSEYRETMDRVLESTLVWEGGREITHDKGLEKLCESSDDCSEKCATQYFCGNGASAAIASHMAIDWSKNAGVRTQAFNDPALLTAVANDIGADSSLSGSKRFPGIDRWSRFLTCSFTLVLKVLI